MCFDHALNKAPKKFLFAIGNKEPPSLRQKKPLAEEITRFTGRIRRGGEIYSFNIFIGPRNNSGTPIIRVPDTLCW
jgi:hypothetical protein